MKGKNLKIKKIVRYYGVLIDLRNCELYFLIARFIQNNLKNQQKIFFSFLREFSMMKESRFFLRASFGFSNYDLEWKTSATIFSTLNQCS